MKGYTMTVQAFYEKMKKVNLQELKQKAVKETEPLMLSLNKEQLSEGLATTGQKISRKYRSTSYAMYKRKLNPKPGFGTPDLRLNGFFYNSFKVLFQGSSFHIKGFTSYSDELEAKYKDIYGFTPLSLNNVREFATRKFVSLWKIAVK